MTDDDQNDLLCPTISSSIRGTPIPDRLSPHQRAWLGGGVGVGMLPARKPKVTRRAWPQMTISKIVPA